MEISKVKVYKKNPKLEDDNLKIIEDLAMAPENVVINIMEEISINSDEYVVKNANEILRNIMGSTEERETMEIPEKIENNPSPDS